MRKDFAKIKAENPDEKASFWKYLRSKDGRQKMLMTGQNTLRMIPGARAVGIALSAVRNSDGLRNSIKELKDGGNSKKAWMKVGIAAAGLLAISVTAACLNDEIAEHVGDFVSNTLGSAKDTIHDTIANVSSHLGIGSANAEELAAAGNSGAAAGAVGIADAQETLTVLHGNPALLDKAARFLDDKTISGLSSQIESGAIPLPEGMTAEDFIYKTSMLKAYAPYAEKETLSMLTAAAAGKSLSAEELTSINESVGRVQASGHYLGNFTKDFSSLSEKEAQSLFNQLAHSKNPQEAYDQMKALHTENPSAFAQVKNEYLPKGSVSASAASHTAETVTNNGSAGAAASTVIANANGSNTVVFGENSSSQVTYRFVQTENGLRLSASGQLSTGNLNEHDAQAYHEALRNNPRMGSLGAQQAVINMKVAESIKEQYQANPSPELEAQYNVAAGQAARYGVKMTNVSESSTSFKTGVVADHTKTTDMVHAPVYVGDANNSNNNLINEQNLNKNFEQNRPNALVMKDEQPFDKTKPNALEMKNETPFDKTKPNALEVKEGQAVQNTTSANNGLLKNGSKISDAQISGYGVDTESGTGFVGITDGTTSNGVYVNRTAHGTSTTVTVNDNSNVRVSVGDDGKVGGKVNINRDADPTKDGVTVTNVSCNTDENSAKVTTTHNKTGIKTTVQKSGDTYSVGAEKGPGRSVTVSMDKKGEISVKAGGSNLPVKKIVDIFKGLKR